MQTIANNHMLQTTHAFSFKIAFLLLNKNHLEQRVTTKLTTILIAMNRHRYYLIDFFTFIIHCWHQGIIQQHKFTSSGVSLDDHWIKSLRLIDGASLACACRSETFTSVYRHALLILGQSVSRSPCHGNVMLVIFLYVVKTFK